MTGHRRPTLARHAGLVGAALVLLAGVSVPMALGQASSGTLFDQFSVEGSAMPVAVSVAVPTYVPLSVDLGLGYTGINVSSTPQLRATAEPLHVPVLSALDLLGGPGVLVPIVLGLIPQLLPSLPAVFGGQPVPLPFNIPLPPLPQVQLPSLPSLQCIAATPSDTPVRNCGVPELDVGGLKLQGVGAQATTAADPQSETLDSITANAEVDFGGADVAEVGSFPASHGYVIHSRTEQKIHSGALEAMAETAVADIDVLGALKIASVQSTLSGRLNGTDDPRVERQCTLAGATLLGVPLLLTQDGLRLGTSGVGADLNRLLAIAPALSEAVHRGVQTVSLPYDFGTLNIEVGGGNKVTTTKRSVAGDLNCLTVSYTIAASATKLRVDIGQSTLDMSVSGGDVTSDSSNDNSSSSVPDVTTEGPTDVGASLLGVTPSSDTSGLAAAISLPSAAPAKPKTSAPAKRKNEVATGPLAAEPASTRTGDWAPAVPLAGLVAVVSVVAGRLRRLNRLESAYDQGASGG